MIEKQFLISKPGSTATSVSVSPELRMILMRPEVREIAGGFGSRVVRDLGSTSIDVVPPVPKDKLSKFGEALVDLARNLDPSDPPPTYKIA